jgi:predicted ATPase/DNA-binding winged helix-turn-helix (wHTH) protein
MTTVYEVGPFRLDPAAGVLSLGGRPMPLGSRAVAVLTSLVKKPNEYVRKESILDAAWPGVVVEEGNLPVQILAIRRALAQAPGGGHWVETLARRGYRFVGPVAVVDDSAARLAAERRVRSNLPVPLTSFIGRERELVEVKRLLPRTRLLTVVGVGGIGKTRLALQVAAEVTDAYRDGVWLVELGSISDPSLVPTSVAHVLGVQERTGTPLTDTLCAHLKARHLLLWLDNCEHLLDACADLAGAVLHGAAAPTIIATSREPLHVDGEQVYALPTLSLADPSASAEDIARSEAVQLFIERARRQLPGFDLTAARASVVAELCTHLDGIPLAVELAAARVRSLSVEQINARLHDRFKLLTSKNSAALPRQQTLRSTFDWSFDLLAEDERTVLRRLAIFPGSFALEAATAVASDAAIDEFAVVDLLAQLVSRSLVVADTNDVGARYRLLETTRAYALEKLVETEEIDTVKHRHAKYFRARFESAHDDRLRMSDTDWDVIYPLELDNVRAALDWAFGAGGDLAIGTALAGASGPIWHNLSLRREGLQRLEDAVARVGLETAESDQARLSLYMGQLWGAAAPAQALAALVRAVDLYRRLGVTSGLGYSLVQLGHRLALMGRCEHAARALADAAPLLDQASAPKVLANYFDALGFLKMSLGDLAGARRYYEKALSLCRSQGAERLAIIVLGNLGDMTWMTGDLDAAAAALREAVALQRGSRLFPGELLGGCLANLVGVLTERGELDEALTVAREAMPLRNAGRMAWCTMDHFALRAALAGMLENAAHLAAYADATFAAKETSRQPNEARAHARLQALLREKLVPDELERLLAEGARMTEDEACRLALEE